MHIASTASATRVQGNLRQRATVSPTDETEGRLFPSHASRSAWSACTDAYRNFRSRSRHLLTRLLSVRGTSRSRSETAAALSRVRLTRLATAVSAEKGNFPLS